MPRSGCHWALKEKALAFLHLAIWNFIPPPLAHCHPLCREGRMITYRIHRFVHPPSPWRPLAPLVCQGRKPHPFSMRFPNLQNSNALPHHPSHCPRASLVGQGRATPPSPLHPASLVGHGRASALRANAPQPRDKIQNQKTSFKTYPNRSLAIPVFAK